MLTDEQIARMRDRVQTAYMLHEADNTRLGRDYPDLQHDYATDVEALLTEVERLRQLAHDEHALNQALVDRINELEAEVERLRARVDEGASGEGESEGSAGSE